MGKSEGRSPLGTPRRRWKTELIQIVKKYNGLAGFIWLGIGTMAGCCEHDDELPDSIHGGEFLGYLRSC
jgi:hypothetical protein